jgi:hypothetical protein
MAEKKVKRSYKKKEENINKECENAGAIAVEQTSEGGILNVTANSYDNVSNSGTKNIECAEIKPVVPKTISFLECHFCGNRQTDINSRDLTSFWCFQCGRCNQVVWKEEAV